MYDAYFHDALLELGSFITFMVKYHIPYAPTSSPAINITPFFIKEHVYSASVQKKRKEPDYTDSILFLNILISDSLINAIISTISSTPTPSDKK